MTKIEAKHLFPSKSSNECYQAILAIIDKAGYKIFKKRDVAWLVMCDGKLQDNFVDLTLSVPISMPTTVSLMLSSEDLDETTLNAEAERIFGLLANSL